MDEHERDRFRALICAIRQAREFDVRGKRFSSPPRTLYASELPSVCLNNEYAKAG